jgi:hypothetical protein
MPPAARARASCGGTSTDWAPTRERARAASCCTSRRRGVFVCGGPPLFLFWCGWLLCVSSLLGESVEQAPRPFTPVPSRAAVRT